MGCETPTGDREAFFFFWLLSPASSSRDRWLEADACVVPSCRSQGWHLVGLCSRFVPAASSCISIQPWGCAASWEGSVCGRAQFLEDPGRSSCGETGRAAASVGGLRFEGQQACDRGLLQSGNSVGFIEDLFSSVCCSIKLREEKFCTASSSLVDLLILTQQHVCARIVTHSFREPLMFNFKIIMPSFIRALFRRCTQTHLQGELGLTPSLTSAS